MLNFKKAAGLLIGASFALFLVQPVHAATYTVAQNDSLYTISKLFNTSAGTIMSNNNLSSDLLYPGQKLYVSAKTCPVKSGDTLYLISEKENVTLGALRKANNKWDNMIYPGQTLNVPASTASQTSYTTQSGSYSASDVDLLARLITAEADGQSYIAKVGVGAVVLNRVADSRFPDSISSVIYERSGGYYQFTPVENGWINKPASAEARKAAIDALNGYDPTNGAVYYFDDSTTNKWIWSKPIAARYGNMVYTY